jgi:V/A-type H+/Na+-transporting ATPase subunit I
MLRPERMTSTSIICVRKDVEAVLETLNTFGEFHIEPSAQDDANLSEYTHNIQMVEERLLDVNGLINQLPEQKTGLLSIFKVTEPTKIQVTADNWRSLLELTNQNILTLKQEMESLNASLKEIQEKTAELTHLKQMVTAMHDVGVDAASMENFKLIHVAVASLPVKNYEAFETAIAGLPLEVHRSILTHEVYFLALAMPTKHWDEVEKILRTYHAEIFQYPSELPKDSSLALKQIKDQLTQNIEQEKELSSKLSKLYEDNRNNLASWKETSQNILALLSAEKKILQSGRLATVKGFVPQNKFQELDQTVHWMLDEKVLVLQNDSLEAKEETPPSKFKHGRFVRPFEEITKLYGMPKYDEVDPTPFIAITFPILFGLMFGDLGQGLVLLIGGLTVGMLIKGNQSMKNTCYIVAACGIGAMGAGLVFGEFFGKEIFPALWFSPVPNVEGGAAALANASTTVFNFLIFALFVGIIQIISGLIIEGVNFALKHDYIDTLLTTVPKIAFYIGGVWLIAAYQLNFAAWLAGPILAPIIPFAIMVAGKPLYLMIAKPTVTHESEHAEADTFTGRLFEGGDFFTRLLSNTISYSRILALLMAHWALLLVTYTVAGLIAPEGAGAISLVLAGVIIVFGNVAVMALEGLIVFIHTLRLHFYEWFSKFYAGTGTEFNPFKQKFDHTTLTLKGKKED